MIIERTDSENTDFLQLIVELDNHLLVRHKEEHEFCKQFNAPESIKYVVVVYDEQRKPIGCGAIREYSDDTMEVKRMFVQLNSRKRGVASMLLTELENWAAELDAKKCILETGNNLPEALYFYERRGYCRISNYGQYQNVESSICFEKSIS